MGFEGHSIMVDVKGSRSGRYAGKLRLGFEEIFHDVSDVQYDVINNGDCCFWLQDCATSVAFGE